MNKEKQKQMVYKLREETTLEIFKCKTILQRVDWDYEKALEYLHKNPKEVMLIGCCIKKK